MGRQIERAVKNRGNPKFNFTGTYPLRLPSIPQTANLCMVMDSVSPTTLYLAYSNSLLFIYEDFAFKLLCLGHRINSVVLNVI